MNKKLLLALFAAYSLNAFAQTTIFSENFEGNSHAFTLNSSGTGDNQWIVNNLYTGYAPFVPNTPNQPGTFTGGTNSKYMHIHNVTACSSLSICNASFDTGSPSDRYSAMTNNISTTGYTNVTLNFWYLSAGASGTSYGTVEYSTNNGSTWNVIGNQLSGVSTWTQLNLSNAALDNQAQLKIRFRWQNGGSGSDPAFAIDEINITGTAAPTASIMTGNPNPMQWCEGVTTNVMVPFSSSGTFNAGNIYTAQLSDAAGSFASPLAIGTLTSTATGTQSINAVVPGTVAAGNAYRIRIVSSNPVVTAPDNGTNMIIHPAATISITPSSGAVTICQGQTTILNASGNGNVDWTPCQNLSSCNQSNVIASPTANITYTATITTTNGCTASDSIVVTVDPCVGIVENNINENIVVFPNPANEHIRLLPFDVNKTLTISIVNTKGQEVSKQTVKNADINVKTLSEGLYFVIINDGENTYTTRFIKQ
jgi:hypothetical protein